MAAYWANTVRVVRRHAYFVGPGIVASVAYADPGNWATDLQAGSEFGYSLLFIVLLTGIFAVFIQILSCRLGIVTNADLARQCRMLILNEDRHGTPPSQPVSHPKWRRWGLLYPLYAIAEGAIVATELAELTGSAIALNLLFPALPLWAGILITSVDVILILFIYRPPPNGSFRLLEGIISVLVFVVLSCFIVLLVRIKPRWPDVFHGYLPSHHVVQSGALYVSVGILGATVMPHAIILGSHFASIDRLPGLDTDESSSDSPAPQDTPQAPHQVHTTWALVRQSFSRTFSHKSHTKSEVIRLSRVVRSLIQHRTAPHQTDTDDDDDAESLSSASTRRRARSRYHDPAQKNLPPRTIDSIRIHIKHASVDIGMSLVSFAIVINSAILIVAAAAFYYTDSRTGPGQVVVASLYDAFYLLKQRLGSLAAVLFAVALLAAGQSASITVTLAGQLVSEGFINWRTDPFIRRIITRLVAVIPSLTVSLAVGKEGLDEMLVASQVALSIALPFVLLPLILVTGNKARMTAKEAPAVSVRSEVASAASSTRSSAHIERPSPRADDVIAAEQDTPASESQAHKTPLEPLPELAMTDTLPRHPVDAETQTQTQQQAHVQTPQAESKAACFANKWYIQAPALAIFGVIVVADVYVLVTTFGGLD
ncbi:related to vacuolar transport protein ESP1 [Moesziomyces antarcticus]|nr:related to vacuolar transport protein ESP1 [Moesziomyces antarcticus]